MSAKRSITDFDGGMPSGKRYFFVTLHAFNKQDTFHTHPVFKTRAEELWGEVMRLYQRIDGAAFNVNSVSLHALMEIDVQVKEGESAPELLGKAIGSYRTLAESEWTRHCKVNELEQLNDLWEPRFEVREIQNSDELESLRDFIVQKMLGGEELTDLGVDDDEEGYY